jgi:hypothetical protein
MEINIECLKPLRLGERGAPFSRHLEQAERFITEFRWCCGIKSAYLGIGVDGIVAVFLCEIDAVGVGVDRWLWIVVGDIPPAYLVTDQTRDAIDALELYITEMSHWVAAVKSGADLDGIIPVNVPPTLASASMLESRLNDLAAYAKELRTT